MGVLPLSCAEKGWLLGYLIEAQCSIAETLPGYAIPATIPYVRVAVVLLLGDLWGK